MNRKNRCKGEYRAFCCATGGSCRDPALNRLRRYREAVLRVREEDFNRKQVFVVMTNGLDYRTREAIHTGGGQGMTCSPGFTACMQATRMKRCWRFRHFVWGDNPYEDLSGGYYILNTNIRNNVQDHEDMLTNTKAAAYFDPWKFKIERLRKGDVVFLYQSGLGTVAVGEADGKLQKRPYHEKAEHKDEEYFMKLRNFETVSPPLKAAEIKRITEIDHRFMSTMFGLDTDSGTALRQHIHDRQAGELMR